MKTEPTAKRAFCIQTQKGDWRMTAWQRDKFEQWCKQQRPPLTLDRDSTGYTEYATFHAWAGWRAAMTIRNRRKKGMCEK